MYLIGHETAKVTLYIKKYSKHDCNNYDPISLLPNIENFLNDTYIHIYIHTYIYYLTWKNVKLNRKRLYPTPSTKYLGVKIDKNLNWDYHKNDLATRLNRKNVLLFTTRNYFDQRIIWSAYFAIFDSHLNYATVVWAQNSNAITQILIPQKSHQNNIISASKLPFKNFTYMKNNILQLSDKTMIDSVSFISKAVNNMLSHILKDRCKFCYNIHHYSTSSSEKAHLHKK